MPLPCFLPWRLHRLCGARHQVNAGIHAQDARIKRHSVLVDAAPMTTSVALVISVAAGVNLAHNASCLLRISAIVELHSARQTMRLVGKQEHAHVVDVFLFPHTSRWP